MEEGVPVIYIYIYIYRGGAKIICLEGPKLIQQYIIFVLIYCTWVVKKTCII